MQKKISRSVAAGLRPEPRCGSLRRSPEPLVGWDPTHSSPPRRMRRIPDLKPWIRPCLEETLTSQTHYISPPTGLLTAVVNTCIVQGAPKKVTTIPEI